MFSTSSSIVNFNLPIFKIEVTLDGCARLRIITVVVKDLIEAAGFEVTEAMIRFSVHYFYFVHQVFDSLLSCSQLVRIDIYTSTLYDSCPGYNVEPIA